MADNTERGKVIIDLETQQAEANLRKLQNELKELKKQYKAATTPDAKSKLSEQIKQADADAKALKAQLRDKITVIINGDLAGKSLRDLEAAAKVLRKELRNMNPNSEEFIKGSKALQQIEGKMLSLNQTLKGTSSLWSRMKDEVKAFGAVAAGYLGFQAMISQVGNLINQNAKLSDSLADIRKTTGLTTDQVELLNKELAKIDTRTGVKDLRDMVVVAGQLGIANDKIARAEAFKASGNMQGFTDQMKAAKDELEGFAKSIDVANVALGDEFTGGAQQVAEQLGKLRLIFADVKSDQVDQDLLHIGNALNELAASGAATGPVVADFANRIGGVGISLGLTTAQVLGLSATLQELNVTTERGGTAVSKILQKMVTKTADFAKVAGMNVEEFKTLVDTDLFGAFNKVVEGIKSGGSSATAFGKILDELGVDGSGASEVMSKLTTNTELLTQKVELSGKAIQNTDSITKEFGIKNETLAAQIDKLGKRFYNFITGPGVTNFLSNQITNLNTFIDYLGRLPQTIEQNRTAIGALILATLAYNASLISTTASSIANTTATHLRNAVLTIHYRLLQLQTAGTAAWGLITDLTTGKINASTAATRIWNAVLKQNPVMWIVGGFIALVEAIDLYRKNTTEAIKLEQEKKKLSEQLVKVNKDLENSMKGFNDEISNFNKLSPQERNELKQRIELKLKEAKATLLQMEAERDHVEQQSKKVGTWQYIWNQVSTGFWQAAASHENYLDAQENGQEAAAVYTDKIEELTKQVNALDGQYVTVKSQSEAFDSAMKINAVTIDQYQEKLKLLRTALGGAVVGSDDFKKISAEIAKVQAQMAQNTDGGTIDLSAKEAAIKQLRDIQISAIDDEEKREIASLQEKHKRDIDEVAKQQIDTATKNELLLALNAKYEQDLTKLKADAAEERNNENFNRDTNDLIEWNETQKLLYIEQLNRNEISQTDHQEKIKQLESITLDEKKKLAEKYGKSVIEIETQIQQQIAKEKDNELLKEGRRRNAALQLRLNNAQSGSAEELAARIALLDEQLGIELAKTDISIEERTLLYNEYYRQIDDLQQQHTQKVVESYVSISNAGVNAFSAISQFMSNLTQKELLDDKNKTDQKKKNLKNLLDSGKIGEAQYRAEIEKLDNAYASKARKAKKEAFVKEKIAQSLMAGINTAAAVVEALPNYILAALVAITGLAQIGVINSTPTPEYRKGKEPITGIVDGPSHEAGGINLVNSQTGKVEGVMEGNEGIISKEMHRNNTEIINAIFEANGKKVNLQELVPAPPPPPDPDLRSVVSKNVHAPEFRNGKQPEENPPPTDLRSVVSKTEMAPEFRSGKLPEVNTPPADLRSVVSKNVSAPVLRKVNTTATDPVEGKVAVNKTELKPELGNGGFLPETNKVLQGPSHANGGLKVVDQSSNTVVAEVEGGEPVISIKSYQKNKQLVDAILGGNGEQVPVTDIINVLKVQQQKEFDVAGFSSPGTITTLEKGGFLPSFSNVNFTTPSLPANPSTINVDRVREIIRQENFSTSQTSIPRFNNSDISSLIDIMKRIEQKLDKPAAPQPKELVDAISKLNSNLENPRETKSYIVYSEFEKSKKTIDNIRNSSGLSRN